MGSTGSSLTLASLSSSKGSSNLNCPAVVLPCPFPAGLQMTSNIWSTWHTQVSEGAQRWAICLSGFVLLGERGAGISSQEPREERGQRWGRSLRTADGVEAGSRQTEGLLRVVKLG